MDINGTLLIISSFIVAIATCLVARYTKATLQVSEEMKKQLEYTHQEYNRLILYLIASTNMNSNLGGSPGDTILNMKKHVAMLRSFLKSDNNGNLP